MLREFYGSFSQFVSLLVDVLYSQIFHLLVVWMLLGRGEAFPWMCNSTPSRPMILTGISLNGTGILEMAEPIRAQQ
jgi:hypothetical protein